MVGGMTMDRQGMKEMRRGMLGASLPPGIDPANFPDPRSTGAQLLAKYLPDPGQHPADEWPGVLGRLTQNMKSMGKPLPDQATLETVVEFLRTHAK